VIYKRGDTHGEFAGVAAFCIWKETTTEDVLIILGDAGINGENRQRDDQVKKYLSSLPITLFCVHGNHDRRPAAIPTYRETQWNGGLCYKEELYPNLIFAKDGEVYDLEGSTALVIGGAASADKCYRLEHGLPWWEDEKPSSEIRHYTEERLSERNWKVDQVLSHTLPLRYVPPDRLAAAKKTGLQDLSTEKWLEKIEQRMKYKKWSAGHWHVDLQINDKVELLYRAYHKL